MSLVVRNLLLLSATAIPPDLALFAKYAASGVLHNFARTDRTFQESTGVTLADDATEAVGLALEESRWSGKTLAQIISEATEKITNGSFVTNDLTGWTNNSTGTGSASGATAAAVLIGTDGSNRGQIAQGYTTVVGRLYRMSWTGVLNSGGITVAKSDAAASQSNAVAVTLVTGVMYYIATATTTYFRALTDTGGGNGSIDNVSVKEIAGNHAIQSANTSHRGLRSANGITFDAIDDNLLSVFTGATSGSILMDVDVPASLGSTQLVIGSDTSGSGRNYLGFNTSKRIVAGVGSDGTSTIVGTNIFTGRCLAGLTYDGNNVLIRSLLGQEYAAAQNGAANTTIPFRIGANNSNGTAGSWFGGTARRCLAIRAAITPAEIDGVLNYWSNQ